MEEKYQTFLTSKWIQYAVSVCVCAHQYWNVWFCVFRNLLPFNFSQWIVDGWWHLQWNIGYLYFDRIATLFYVFKEN